MRTVNLTLWILALGALVMLCTSACGGSGGTTASGLPSSSLGLYAGTYHYVGFSGATGVPEIATGQWGRLDANGAGTVTGGFLSSNANGALSGPDPLNTFAYEVDAARRLTWRFGGAAYAQGGISASGRTAALASVLPGSNPALFFMSLVDGTFTAASLSGLYHAVLISYNGLTLLDITHWGTVTFDGVGTATVDVDTNVGGTINSVAPFMTPYVVGADGKVRLDYGVLVLEGGMLDGGELVVLGGSSTAGGLPALVVLVRGSSAASLATLNGAYHALGLTATIGGVPAWGAFTTTASADGNGTLTVDTATFNVDGVISPLGGAALAYSVAADGTLGVATGEPVQGGVSTTGDFAVFGGATGVGDAPIFWFLMR